MISAQRELTWATGLLIPLLARSCLYLRLLLTVVVVLMGSSATSHGQDGSNTVLVANFVNGNNVAFNSRVYLFNPSQSAGDVTVRVFTLPLSGGTAQELTASPLNLGSLGANSALNVKLAEDILAPLGITLPYTDNDGDLTLEFTIEADNVRGATQVFSSSLAFGTNPLQEIPSTSTGSPTVLVANFMNGNDAAFNSRVYLFNPSPSAGDVTVRVFTLPLASGTVQELTGTPLNLGPLGARSALNVRLAEDILTPLGITTPHIIEGGNLALEFTIQAADVRGAAQVFSSSFAFGVYPMQQIPPTSSGIPTVLVANFMNGNDDAFNSRVYLWNPSQSAGDVTARVFTLPLSSGLAQELTVAPLDLGTLGAKSALNVKLAEDILAPLGIALPYTTDGGNLTLEFTIQAADVRGAAQVFSSSFAFGTNPLQEIPSISSGSSGITISNLTSSADILFPSDGSSFSLSSGESFIALPIIGSVLAEFDFEAMQQGSIDAVATLLIPATTIASCTIPLKTTQMRATYQVGQIAGTVSGSAIVLNDFARVGIVWVCLLFDAAPTFFGVPAGAQPSIDLVPLPNGADLADGTALFFFADTFNGLSDQLAFPPGFTQDVPLAFGRWQIFPPGTYTVSLTLTVGKTSVATTSSSFTVTEGP